ncbi:MAG: zinc ABC transporter substrate-binding protein [Burkholderiales bacterium]
MRIRILFFIFSLIAAAPATAALNVLACEPEWGALTRELAGDRAKVYEASTALQDVHHIQARPSLIAAARRANLVVCTGAELEVGWLPVLTSESGNARIQPSAPGYFEASRYVNLIEIPKRLDRREGDVHAMGNPHIQTDPRNIAKVAPALAARLAQIDPPNAAWYQQRYESFAKRWQQAIARWQSEGAPLKGLKVVAHHEAFDYMFRWLGIEQVGALEPLPGVDPTISHMSELLRAQKTNPAKLVVRASFNDPRASEWFAGRAGIPAVMLPFSVGGDDASKDLFSWYDDMLAILLKAPGK